MNILILNGPNLNLLGQRESEHYGSRPWAEIESELIASFENETLTFHQSNVEGELIDQLQKAKVDGVVFNTGGFTHTSIAIADAIRSISPPVVEVHMSNLARRENERQHSMISDACDGYIDGLGVDSYKMGIEHLIHLLEKAKS